MPTTTEAPLNARHLMALRNGSALWASYDWLVANAARFVLPVAIDHAACRAILALNEAIERGERVDEDEAAFAVRAILGCYPKVHHHDPEMMAMMMGLALMERPSGIVMMAVDRKRGIPGQCKFAPSMAQVSEILETITDRVRAADRAARRALGLIPDVFAGRE